MKFFISFILITISINITAQDWFPFPVGQKSYYLYDGVYYSYGAGVDSTISIYYCDSINNFGTYQIYNFDYSTPDYNTCYESVNHSTNSFGNFNYDFIRPDSVIKMNDSLFLAYSDKQPFGFTDSILFLPKIGQSSSWFSTINHPNYDSIKFTCDSTYIDTIIENILDSVKLISLQAYYNGNIVSSNINSLKIILSKSYGITQFVSFYNNHIETPLIGIDSNSTKYGFEISTFSDYFHLGVSDILIWQEYFDSYDFFTPSYTKYFKDSITAVNIFQDSAHYSIFRTHDIGPNENTVRSHYKKNLKGLELSSLIYIDRKSIKTPNYGFSYNDLLQTSNIYFTSDTIINRQFSFEGFSYDSSNCNAYTITDVWDGAIYNTYYGLYSYWFGGIGGNTSFTIIGSVISGVQTGNVWNVDINKIKQKENFTVYPNPTNNKTVHIQGNNIKSVSFFNLDGRLIESFDIKAINSSINLNKYDNGIYLIKILFESGLIQTQKLILN